MKKKSFTRSVSRKKRLRSYNPLIRQKKIFFFIFEVQNLGPKKKPLSEDRGFWMVLVLRGVYQPPQEPELQEPELHPPPPTGLAEVMEKPER